MPPAGRLGYPVMALQQVQFSEHMRALILELSPYCHFAFDEAVDQPLYIRIFEQTQSSRKAARPG